MKHIQNKLISGFILGIAVLIGLGLYADFTEMGRLLKSFNWAWLPAILGLTVINYVLRFTKWHYYLHQIGVKDVSVADDFRIFFGGFGLSLTPGKLGELIRTLWLKNIANIHPAKTAPMVFGERLTDGIAMIILSVLGGFVYSQYWPVTFSIGAILILAVVIIQIRPLALWLLTFGETLPIISKIAHPLHLLYESAYELLKLKNLIVAVSLGLMAWISQGLAFYLILISLGVQSSLNLAFLSIFILAFALVAGGASGIPGGLGVTESGITGMLQLLIAVPESVAATATLLIRFCVLWFSVILGMLIIIVWYRFLFGAEGDNVKNLVVKPSGEV
jgi:uncharacterized membrane protein YbhN (UPF0104 family)